MVNPATSPHPEHLLLRLRRTIHRPSDLWFTLRIGWFLWRIPARINRQNLPSVLAQLAKASRPTSSDPASAAERIIRLRGLWLRRKPFLSRNTCYLRALTLYRFLDAGHHEMRIHFAVEPGNAAERHRGHAWITLDGQSWEPPDAVQAARVREIFVFPQEPKP